MIGKRVVRGEVAEIVAKTVGVAAMIEGIVIEIGAETVEMAETIEEAEMGEIAGMVEKAGKTEKLETAGIAEEIARKEKM